MPPRTNPTKRKKPTTSRITIRLTSCDALTLRRLARAGKAKPSEVVRDVIRAAGSQLEAVTALAKASGKTPAEVAQGMLAGLRDAAESFQPSAPSSSAAEGAEDLL